MNKQPNATFSIRPGIELIRSEPITPIERLFLAGDWTRTGWPATMESAVRSGYRAAECILSEMGSTKSIVKDGLPASGLSRWLMNQIEVKEPLLVTGNTPAKLNKNGCDLYPKSHEEDSSHVTKTS